LFVLYEFIWVLIIYFLYLCVYTRRILSSIQFVLPLLLPALCQAALYTANTTTLDAATGKVSWEGPDDHQSLNVQTGTHTANSTFSYFSTWSETTVNCSATAQASLDDAMITLSASNLTNGYDYNDTQGTASASVDFFLPAGEAISLNDSTSAADPGQVSWTLTGPGGWTWTGPFGSFVAAPAGDYTFGISASIVRMAGDDFSSTNNASLQFAPEPEDALLLMILPVMLGRKRRL
jgi:glucose dehydrogenase